jgi:hypothetical protein
MSRGRKKRAPPSEGATAYYFSTPIRSPLAGQRVDVPPAPKECKNLDEALIFVMEKLEEHRQHNAYIKMSGRPIYFDEIKQRYDALKK